jgi:hypothetical protein
VGHAAGAWGGIPRWSLPPHRVEASPRGICPADSLLLTLTKETTLIPRRLETNCADFYVTLLIVMIPARESLQRFYQWMHCSVHKLDWDL